LVLPADLPPGKWCWLGAQELAAIES
jgi:hypothetical protein